MPVETLVCHNCGAPVRPKPGQTLVLCPYCYASTRIDSSQEGPAQVTSAGTLSEETAAAIRRLLAEGNRDEAVQRYQADLRCEPREALQAVQGLFERDVFMARLMKQQLKPSGVVVAILCFVVLCASPVFAFWVEGTAGRIAAIVVFGVAFVIFPLRRLLTTLRYLGAERGTALVRKLVWLGEVKGPWGPMACARAWVDVRAASGAGFSASLDIVTLTKERFFEGAQLDVKFFGADPDSLLLARHPPPR